MRPIVAEQGMVKLIHPGRYVEILKQPVTVAEVMSKNPRHCIARPDVFKYPWIVMKPESVLPSGKVFLLVPNRTLYDLMKYEKYRTIDPPGHPTNSRRDILTVDRKPKTTTTTMTSTSPPKAFAGMTPKHIRHHNPSHISQRNDTSFRRPPEQDSGERFLTPWMDERNSYREFQRLLMAETSEVGVVNGGDGGGSSSGQGQRELKSCMRKPGSVRKSLGLRVSFVDLPISRDENETHEDPQISRESVRLARLSDLLNW